MRRSRKKNNIHPSEAPLSSVVTIESLDHEGRGVAHFEGKTLFIEGALPFERVNYTSFRVKPSFENAVAVKITNPSFVRTTPKCPYFGVCGGCSMQHVDANAQVAVKQRVLEDNLWHIGKVKADTILPPLYGQTWGYRHRARISVKSVLKKGCVLVGFHEKRSSFIADMQSCAVLPPKISALLPKLRVLVAKLSILDRLPQIELASGSRVDVLVLRIMDPLTPEDEAHLKQFADAENIQFWLQTKGPDTAAPFYPLDAPPLSYELPEFNISMPYRPTEFTQVNPNLNRMMVQRAIQLLDPQPDERIADMFCGLGNFTLPIARRGAQVLGMEGAQGLVSRAIENAVHNQLAERVQFQVANLFDLTPESLAELGHFDKMLIDPPRDGALALVQSFGENTPRRLVYVSCSPATLARDAGILVHEKGYRLVAAGMMNMFPHTAHVESIAVFERTPQNERMLPCLN